MFSILFQFYTDRARLTSSNQELFYRYCGLIQSIHLNSATQKTYTLNRERVNSVCIIVFQVSTVLIALTKSPFTSTLPRNF